jgi:lipopolysaccharide transport system ATP-binding protein
MIASANPKYDQLATGDGDVLVSADNVGKIFCRDFKKSLIYGFADSAKDLIGKSSHRKNERGLRPGEFWANRNITFDLKRGECLGLIGHNGAGKTTFLKMLNGLIKPDEGSITLKGRIGALIALGAGFNPLLTGLENIYVNGSILGLSRRMIDDSLEEIIDFADVREFLHMPLQSYSSGMQVRLGFAIATVAQPDSLIVDEVLAVGDSSFRNKCLTKIRALMDKGTSTILVTHQLQYIQNIATKAMVLERGCIDFYGEPQRGMFRYNELQKKNSSGAPQISAQDPSSRILPAGKDEDSEIVSTSPIEFRCTYKDDAPHETALVLTILTLDCNTVIARYRSSDYGITHTSKAGDNFECYFLAPFSLSPGDYLYQASIINVDIGFSIQTFGMTGTNLKFTVHPTNHPSEATCMMKDGLIILSPAEGMANS